MPKRRLVLSSLVQLASAGAFTAAFAGKMVFFGAYVTIKHAGLTPWRSATIALIRVNTSGRRFLGIVGSTQ